MSLNTRIKERRERLGISRSDLAEMIGVTPSAIANYENGISTPKVELLYKLFDALKCDANYLYQDEINVINKQDNITPAECEIIRKYNFLDSHGKHLIDVVLSAEYERCKEVSVPKRNYIYLRKIAAAGSGFLIDDIPTETIEAPEFPGADFIIGVNGDSMEPSFHDGDMVYVQRSNSINVGEIGIFVFCGACYIKELGENGLVSHNPNYRVISGDREIRCVGRVLGKVE